jgi:hypothetical protein
MKVGAAQIDITPVTGTELSGFAVRIQPSAGFLDRLYAKALWAETGEARLLWIHCDLIGLTDQFVAAFRAWAGRELGLAANEVMVSTTHTHSGPCTIRLEGCGNRDEAYTAWLAIRLQELAATVRAGVADCAPVAFEGRLDLAVDRRGKPSAHTDPRLAVIGFKRADGGFAAVIANHPIHPVALGNGNRLASGDLFGFAAEHLSARLPGRPVVLMTNGACGNLNPPTVGAPVEQVQAWGRLIAGTMADGLLGEPSRLAPVLHTRRHVCALPLDVPDRNGVEALAAAVVRGAADGRPAWLEKITAAAKIWQQERLAEIGSTRPPTHREVELFAVQFGDLTFVGGGAEIFSNFTDWLRASAGPRVYTVGYANGNCGYLSTRAAYAEGGYEVDMAHYFYGSFRFACGALEQFAAEAADLLKAGTPR